MITITALKWAPPFAQGKVRDLRVRWALEEAGLPYEMRLIDSVDQKSKPHRGQQPFGQIPVMTEGGVSLFESGAIVLDIAERGNVLLPADPTVRRMARCWVFAALNSIEPRCANLAEVDLFLEDEAMKAARRPLVLAPLQTRLDELETALGKRDYLAGDAFSVADLLMTTVLRILDHTALLMPHAGLVALKARCEGRPAFARALEGQMKDFRSHAPADMKYGA